MPNLYPLRFILSVALLTISFSRPALAVSKGYDAPAQVILKDGHPCFFADMGTQTPAVPSQTITVVSNRDTTKYVWQINEKQGERPLPTSAERCVKYGEYWPTAVIVTAPEPLQYDMPYFVDIATRIGNGTRFRIAFCLSKDANEKPLLTKWAKDGKHCTNRPLSDGDRPWLLEWLFGR